MSTLAATEVVEEHRSAPSLVVVEAKPAENEQGILDRHPLVPIFIAGVIAFAVSSAMIGSIVLWLSLRHSGVMAP
jgi:hypothetical protein